ncbi:saccharopine dehydrogenase [Paenibacillus sp. ACRRX]|uniref:saccharopine dehydrogenase n=1 Tax=unclassified Paenibacillus TaxID=185978 RepID=UPI001EF6E312|nr:MULTISPECIES: saccharopine dehydrogenase [unclassified Paenibacillus]MCG7408275.1 saccharopine dehydrogenase [Paenibacillus sp. ACRRX]MDK8181340.1 saccharopine dehydrogenase [Paenibacillus sp. UMB4589-SE434]
MKNQTSGNRQVVLIVGGYGVVGSQIAHILLQRHPEVVILLGGRNPNRAVPFEPDRVQTISINNMAEDPLEHVSEELTLIINVVNDLEDHLLLSAVRRGIPLLDVTRWTERFQQSIDKLEGTNMNTPVVFSSGWMGGTAALFAQITSEGLWDVHINIHALYSLKDKAGPDSTAYMDRLSIPFEIVDNKVKRSVYPMTDPVRVRFPNDYATKSYRLDTPDHVTLARGTNTSSVHFRIAFDNKVSTGALVAMVRTGLWGRLSGERFRRVRHSLLYNPGSGNPHYIVIHIRGRNVDGQYEERTIQLTDPLGQTHLTALGAAIQAENILRAPDNYWLNPRAYYPEELLDLGVSSANVFDYYRAHGVVIN